MPNEPIEASSGGRTRLVPVSRFGRLLPVAAGDTRHVRIWLDTGVRFPPASGVKPADEPSSVPLHFHQGVVGTTRRGPITPVAQPGQLNDAPCAATLRVYRPDGAGAASFDHAAPFSIRIARGAWRSLTIIFDTGIR